MFAPSLRPPPRLRFNPSAYLISMSHTRHLSGFLACPPSDCFEKTGFKGRLRPLTLKNPAPVIAAIDHVIDRTGKLGRSLRATRAYLATNLRDLGRPRSTQIRVERRTEFP